MVWVGNEWHTSAEQWKAAVPRCGFRALAKASHAYSNGHGCFIPHAGTLR